MKKFEGILICTDLDGTLLRNDKSISKENIEAIEYFKSEGGYFTFITGRMPYFVSDIYETIDPNVPFGCINGGGLFDHRKQEYVWSTTLDRSALELVDDVWEKLPEIGIQACTFEKIYFSRENAAMKLFREDTGMPNIIKHYREVEEPLAKIVFGDVHDENILKLDALLHSHPRASEFGFVRSDFILYEILPKGIGKGNVIVKLADLLGIDISRTVAIGDYNNDVTMLKAAGVGVAVSNATPLAKAAAKHITVSNEEHAIAKVISDIDLLLAR